MDDRMAPSEGKYGRFCLWYRDNSSHELKEIVRLDGFSYTMWEDISNFPVGDIGFQKSTTVLQ